MINGDNHIIPDESLPSHSVFVRHTRSDRENETDSFASIATSVNTLQEKDKTTFASSSTDFTAHGNPARYSNESVMNSFKKGKSSSNNNTPQASPASTPTRNKLKSAFATNNATCADAFGNSTGRLSMNTTSADKFDSIVSSGNYNNSNENNFVVHKPSLSKPPLTKRGSSGREAAAPRPFLKRGSRKEPSALHRVNVPNPTPTYGLSDRQSGAAMNVFHPNTTGDVMGASSSMRSTGGGDGHVFVKPHAATARSQISSSHSGSKAGNKTNDYMENTDDATSNLLQTKQLNAIKELDEFLLLEKELDVPSSATTHTSTAASSIGNRGGFASGSTANKSNEYDYYDVNGDDDSFYQTATSAQNKFAVHSNAPLSTRHDVGDDYNDDDADDSGYIDSYYNKYSNQAPAASKATTTSNRSPAAVPPHKNVSSYDIGGSSAYDYDDEEDNEDDDGYNKNTATAATSSRPTIRWSDKFKPVSLSSATNSINSGNNIIRSRPSTSSGHRSNSINSRDSDAASKRPSSASAAPTSNQNSLNQMQIMIGEKAKELENELHFYRQENSNLKKLKMKQESTLSEVLAQRTEMMKWIDEEKLKTAGWCEEQRSLATRDRRAAAKVARDMRQKAMSDGLATGSVRKEKAEIDALTATIEKIKIDADTNNKKVKMNEKRLNALIKELSDKNEDLSRKIIVVETEKMSIVNYLEKEMAIKLPNYLFSKGGKVLSQRGSSAMASCSAPDSYVEEVPVEDYSAYIYRDSSYEGNNGSASNAHFNPQPAQEDKYFNRFGSQSSSKNSSIDYSTNFIDTTSAQSANVLRGSFNSVSSSSSNHNIINKIDNSAINSTSISGRVTPVVAVNANANANANKTNFAVAASNLSLATGGDVDNAVNSRTEETLPDGRRVIKYRNGTVKELFPDGSSLVKFTNGDTKHINALNGVVIYYYAQAQTKHTTFPDGLEVYEFPNKQIERHFSDGTKEIVFPDNTKKIIRSTGVHESYFPDGVIVKEFPDGSKEVFSDNKVQFIKKDANF